MRDSWIELAKILGRVSRVSYLFCVGAVVLGTPLIPAHGDDNDPTEYSALVNHPSPYLRAHADDPVSWRILTASTMELAGSSGMPIFISSGYQSCYWCYRLKQDTFVDRQLADLINQNFIPILIDRELWQEDDRLLQAFARETLDFSGWPLSVVMTPAGDPIFGYGYIDSRSLTLSLEKFIRAWRESSQKISRMARLDAKQLLQSELEQDEMWTEGSLRALLDAFIDQANASADMEYGGFGRIEKYPYVPQLIALLDLNSLNPDPQLSAFIRLTLDNLIGGGLIDKVEGGVFRYTEQRDWKMPHFEQMLGTQAMVSKLLLRAAQTFNNVDYQTAGIRILDNMVRRMESDGGWYVSSLSAYGSNGKDGGYYTWDPATLNHLLGGVWQDYAMDLLPHADAVLPAPSGNRSGDTLHRLQKDRKLRASQQDSKILIGLNGLALSALVAGASVRAEFVAPARALAQHLATLVASDPVPFAANKNSSKRGDLTTYVYTAAGLFDWWQLTAQDEILDLVADLLVRANENFYKEGAWITNRSILIGSNQGKIAIRDGQLPSPSAEWFRLASALAFTKSKYGQQFTGQLDRIAETWSKSMHSEAFFHGTIIASMVTRKWLTNNDYGTLESGTLNVAIMPR